MKSGEPFSSSGSADLARELAEINASRDGCTPAGDTESEAWGNIEDAIRLYLAPSDIDPQDASLIEVMDG